MDCYFIYYCTFCRFFKTFRLSSKEIFFPPSDEPSFTVEMRLPIGTAIETTRDNVLEIENYIKKISI